MIDSETAAAGDPIEVVLRSPIRGKNNVPLAPAGARLHARLVGLEHRFDAFRVSLQFESIDLKSGSVPLRAMPDTSTAVGVSVFSLPVIVSSDLLSPSVTRLFVRKQRLRLERFEWGWITLAPGDDNGADPH